MEQINQALALLVRKDDGRSKRPWVIIILTEAALTIRRRQVTASLLTLKQYLVKQSVSLQNVTQNTLKTF